MDKKGFYEKVKRKFSQYEGLINKPNSRQDQGNGIFDKYNNPIITRDHIPPFWEYDLNYETNPHLMTRLGINTTFNAGAIKLNGKYYLVVRIEGFDVKSILGVAESDNGISGWRFWNFPIDMPINEDPEMNVYDMRLTQHEDGWIYGLFCAERKDLSQMEDSSAALASGGIARTKDLKTWERLPDLISHSQQRNVVLHPTFVEGKYMLYTRPQTGFIETGDSGVHVGFVEQMTQPKLISETLLDPRQYHTVKEVKNGQGPPPIKTKIGWIHLMHGVRKTAAGLRYTLYVVLSDLNTPWKIIKRPSGHFLEPLGLERLGDVSNVVFSNGWILDDDGKVFIYYASSDTRMHVATTTVEKLIDYVQNTPVDGGNTRACAEQRIAFIKNNLKTLENHFPEINVNS
jgi:4-O-beta-D-mannosyl-D-glucose phosphorylase